MQSERVMFLLTYLNCGQKAVCMNSSNAASSAKERGNSALARDLANASRARCVSYVKFCNPYDVSDSVCWRESTLPLWYTVDMFFNVYLNDQ